MSVYDYDFPEFTAIDFPGADFDRWKAGEPDLDEPDDEPREPSPMPKPWPREPVRPVRTVYRHAKCDTTSELALMNAREVARVPTLYRVIYCSACGLHLPVSEFYWEEDGETVGSNPPEVSITSTHKEAA